MKIARQWSLSTRLLGAALGVALVGGCGLRRDHADVVGAAQLSIKAGPAVVPGASDRSPVAAQPSTQPAAAAALPAGGTGSANPVGSPSGSSSAGRPASADPAGGTAVISGSRAPGVDRPGTGNGAAAGTGSSGRSTTTTGPAAAAGGTPSAGQREPIRIGSVGTLSGPAGDLFKDGVFAVQVWAQWINTKGGINGHRVVYSVADDGADPARHRGLVQELVEKRGVIAFVQNQEGIVGESAAEYPTKHRIPVINTESSGNYPYDSPMYFPTAPSGDEMGVAVVGAIARFAVPAGKRKLGILYCAEAAACKNFERVWTSDRAKKLGFEPVYQAAASIVQPDFTSECLGARQAGAEVLALAMDNNSIARIAASCKRQGYAPLLGVSSVTALPNLRRDPDLEGTVVGSHTFAWPASDRPALQEFHDVFAQFAPGTEISGSHALGWTAAKAFEAAAALVGDQPSSEQILQGLWRFDGNDLGGLTYPLRFVAEQPAKRRACWSVVIIRNGAWVAPDGGAVKCETPNP